MHCRSINASIEYIRLLVEYVNRFGFTTLYTVVSGITAIPAILPTGEKPFKLIAEITDSNA